MSEMIRQTGTLQKLNLGYMTIEEYCKEKVLHKSLELLNAGAEDNIDFVEIFEEEFEGEFVIINNDIYKIANLEQSNMEDDSFEITSHNGKFYHFNLQYYNGGCSLMKH